MKLTLSLPVTPYGLNQGFGINGEYYRLNGINVLGHNGLDLRAYHGQPVYAAHDGKAVFQTDSQGGHGVVLFTNEQYDYKDGQCYFKTIYWHFASEDKYKSPIQLAQEEKGTNYLVPVKRGDLIGYADSTGLSSGDHLHFGLKPIKPGIPPLSGDTPDVFVGNWVNIEVNNGYTGAIDPTLYLENTPKFFFNRDLSYGSIGPDVIELQKRLSISPTWYMFGPKTKEAVIAYQKAHGINPTGFVGPITRGSLNQ